MENIFSFPIISVAIVNLDGKSYLKTCLDSLRELDYPADKLETIVVDNGSKDSSPEFIRKNYPDVKLIENTKNLGFAYANNQAARAASGEYIAFLNNDTRVDKSWLIELLKPVYKNKETVCSGSKVLSMDGKRLDFAGGMINFEAKGFQIDYNLPVEKDTHNQLRFTPFVNGGAMLIDRKVFLDAGGFDEDFFAYYEDVDLGWRLWVLGYKVIFCPSSIVYHVHHGTSDRFADEYLRFLKERNSLYIAYKNYDDENLSKVLSSSILTLLERVFTGFKLDEKSYDLKYIEDIIPQSLPREEKIDRGSASSLAAAKDFVKNLPSLKGKRDFIQSRRKKLDKAIFSYFKGQFLSSCPDRTYQENQIQILKSLGIYDMFVKKLRTTLLIISNEIVGKNMAGPGIRALNIARVTSQYMNVILAIPNEPDIKEDFEVIKYDTKNLPGVVERSDIVMTSGIVIYKFKFLENIEKILIIDLYDPYNIASIVENADLRFNEMIEMHDKITKIINTQIKIGDFFICASERQRDYWLGMLSALGRIDPYMVKKDSSCRILIDIVPFGLSESYPSHKEVVMRNKIGNIKDDDFVIIWGGGIYNWFDTLTLIRAMSIIRNINNKIKLFFLGIRHPNPEVTELELVNKTVALSKNLGLYDKNVFFNFGWVDYDKRQNYLLESDVGIITHPEHIETRFAFRTRILDYIWSGLPIISTRGDSLSELVEKEQLGITVADGDVEGVAGAIIRLKDDRQFYQRCKLNLEKVATHYTWEEVCKPLIRFCEDPVASAVRQNLRPDQIHTSIDVLDIAAKGSTSAAYTPSAVKYSAASAAGMHSSSNAAGKRGAGYLIKRFFHHLFKSGPKKAAAVCSNYLKNR